MIRYAGAVLTELNIISTQRAFCVEYPHTWHRAFFLLHVDVLLWKERSDERLKPICGNGRGVLFEALQCYVKAAKQIGAKVNWNAVECKDRKKCKICNYSRTVAIPFNGFLGSDCFAIIGSAVFTGGLFPKHIEQFKIIPDEADADAYIELGNNLKYAKKARQARFEHGETPEVIK